MKTKTLISFIMAFSVLMISPPVAAEEPEEDALLPAELTPKCFVSLDNGETVVFLLDWTESMSLQFGNSTRADRVKSEVERITSKFSNNVKAAVVLYCTSEKCKYSGVERANMASEEYLSRFLWWAYKGKIEDGTLELSGVAYVWAGPYTYIIPPADAPACAGEIAEFLAKRKPQGFSAMGAGLFAALHVKGVNTILMALDGPPEVLEDGRQWTLSADAPDFKEWKESPYFPQGHIPKHGIDGHVLKIAETKIGETEVLKGVNFHAAYFDMPAWGVKLLEDIAKISGGTAKKIGK
jgi:hypothetical protein